MRNNGGNNKAFEFGKNRAKLQKGKTTTFDNVAGVEEEKEELADSILINLKDIYKLRKNFLFCAAFSFEFNFTPHLT